MATRIVVLTTDGFSREDGNVYYSRYLIVSSDTLNFSEPIFIDSQHPLRTSSGDSNDNMSAIEQELIDLGYVVAKPDVEYIEVKS